MTSSIPPLLPKLDAILVLDGDGNRLAGKYYNTAFLKKAAAAASDSAGAASSVTDSKVAFEKQLQQKLAGIAARSDAAEVVTVAGRTAVFCGGTAGAAGGGGGDVRVVHVGPPGESELVLAYLCEGMYDALLQLMGGSADRNMVLDNLELVFLLIDEHCDGGIILEVDGSKLAAAVMLRDEERDAPGQAAGGAGGGGAGGAHHPGGGVVGGAADMTIGQALRQAREQFMANMTSRDGV